DWRRAGRPRASRAHDRWRRSGGRSRRRNRLPGRSPDARARPWEAAGPTPPARRGAALNNDEWTFDLLRSPDGCLSGLSSPSAAGNTTTLAVSPNRTGTGHDETPITER